MRIISEQSGSFLQKHQAIILFLFLAFIIRALPAFLFFGSYDSFIASDTYYSVLKAGNINALFVKHAGMQHFPGWTWLLYLIGICSDFTGIPYHTLFKFPAIFADLAITILIYKVFLKRGLGYKKSSFIAACYAFNPVAVIITSVNGQFDSLTAFLCLLSWYLWTFADKFKTGSGIFLGMGTIIKEFPALLLPVFLAKMEKMKQRLGYFKYFLLPIFISIIIACFTTTLKFIPLLIKYTSTRGFWGLSLISMFLSNNNGNAFFYAFNFFILHYMRYILLLLIIIAWVLCFNKKVDLLTSIVFMFLVFYFFTPGLGAQYLVWIVPFAVLRKDPMLKFYTFFVSVVVALWFAPVLITGNPLMTYNSFKWLNFTRNLFSMLGWVTVGIWLYRLFKLHLIYKEQA